MYNHARQSEVGRQSVTSSSRAARLGAAARHRGHAARPRRLKPELVRLESRRLLSTFDVTSTADDGSTGTLRWAVAQANAATAPSTIDFQFGGVTKTITLTQGPLVLNGFRSATTIDGPGANLLIIDGNNASGVFQVDSSVTTSLSGLTIEDGSTSDSGGGLENAGTVTLTACTIINSSAHISGGGVDNGGTATLTDCTISGNSAGGGGGLYNTTLGTLNLTDCSIGGNTAEGGGGLVNSGAATLTDCTISGNSAGGGGGLYSTNLGTAPFSLIGCTIDANFAGSSGGGLRNHGTATITLTDCTVDGNSAGQDGGGLYNDSTPNLSLTACTITGNSASGGDGLYTASGTATLTDTIITGNVTTAGTPSDISGKAATGVTGSYNLVGTGGAGGLAAADHNMIGAADPQLALLGNYGGATETMALLPGSPALGAGTAVSGVTTDQRGLPLDSPPDIGAYQVQAPGVTTFDVTSTADDGSAGTLRWAVAQANAATSASTIDFKLPSTPATITLAQGQLELSNTAAAITIEGPGASLLAISGNNASRVFTVDKGVLATISGLTITAGAVPKLSGGLYGYGGGLDNESGSVTLSNCTISGNNHEGLYNHGGTALLLGCTVDGNDGGGVGVDGTTTFVTCTISGNTGSGVSSTFSDAKLTGCTISGNTSGSGGGLATFTSTITLTDCTIGDNTSTAPAGTGHGGETGGGGLEITDGSATLTGCTISGNTAANLGGGLFSAVSYGYAQVTLTDTIVAGNAASAEADIEGKVSGSYDLIGIEGAGGLTNGTDGNLVGISDPELGPLANNGGPTQTMALLPGSPAIGAGTAVSGVTTDQRGQPLDAPHPDIGAFQTQGSSSSTGPTFSGLSSPSIGFGTASVTISGTLANGSQAPQGEALTITLNGVSQQATIGAGGAFSSTFDTNTLGVSGSPYTVSYSYPGDTTYGAATDTSTLTVSRIMPTVKVADAGGAFTGHAFSAAATVTGVGGSPAASLEGVTPTLSYYAGTSANGTPTSGPPSQGGIYTVVASFPGSANYGPARSSAVNFTINPAVTSIALTPSTTSTAYGQSITFVATVTGSGATPGGTVTFSDSGTVMGTALVDASGQATLITAALPAGDASVTASFGGNADLAPASSESVAVSVTQAGAQPVVQTPQTVVKKNRVVSVVLSVQFGSTTAGTTPPSGTATFEQIIKARGKSKSREKVLGRTALVAGRASLSLKAKQVLNKTIAVVYSGDADYQSDTVTLPLLTSRTLNAQARTASLLRSPSERP